MSRVGCCVDNRPTEGLCGIMYYSNQFHDKETLEKAIKEYIYFYNHERFQNRYNNQTPIEIRGKALNSETIEHHPIPEKRFKTIINN